MNEIKIEIGHYRELNKGSLKASFSIVIRPEEDGLVLNDCCYFEQGNNKWVNFPRKEVKYTDGRKSDYFPLVDYRNKDYMQQLKSAVIEEVNKITNKEGHEQEKGQSDSRKKDSLPPTSPPSWSQRPF